MRLKWIITRDPAFSAINPIILFTYNLAFLYTEVILTTLLKKYLSWFKIPYNIFIYIRPVYLVINKLINYNLLYIHPYFNPYK